jgi:hypothetical protein
MGAREDQAASMSNRTIARAIKEEAKSLKPGHINPYDARSVREQLGPLGIVGFGAETQARGTERHPLFIAWEKKYRRYPARVEQAWLCLARPVDIVRRMEALGVRDPLVMCATSFGADFKGMIPVYTAAFKRVHGRLPNSAELEAEMSVGHHETAFGQAKFPGGLGPGMHNHGAVQCCKPTNGVCPANTFLSEDSSPQPTGASIKYAICFKKYATDEDGAADVISHVGKRPLEMLKQYGNSLAAFAAGMYLNGYFESFNATDKVLGDPRNKVTRDALVSIGKQQGAVKDKDKLSDPQRAGRVLMYAIGLDKSAADSAKATATQRQTGLTVGSSTGMKIGIGLLVASAATATVAGGLYITHRKRGAA